MAAAFHTLREAAQRKLSAHETAEQMYLQISARLASNTLSGVFWAWRDHAHRFSRLRLILQKILGRTLEFAFYGWM